MGADNIRTQFLLYLFFNPQHRSEKMNLRILGISFVLAACAPSFAAAEAAVPGGNAPAAPAADVPAPVPAPERKAEAKLPAFSPEIIEVSASVPVPTPIFGDQKNLQDKTFDADAKLRLSVPAPERLAYARVFRGGNGFFAALVKASEAAPLGEDTLTIFRTCVTPATFTRSKIKLSSPQKYEFWLDGKKITEKLAAETGTDGCSTTITDFNFERRRHEIVVKMLTLKGSTIPPSLKIEIEAQNPDVPAVVFSDGKEKRPVTIADVNETERPTALLLSPDGKYLLRIFSRLRDDGSAVLRQEVRETAGGRVVFAEDRSRNYEWMPNGSVLFYRRKDTDGRCSLVGFDLETRRESVLAEGLPDEDHAYVWLPDESGLIVSKTEKWKEESADWRRVLNIADRDKNWRNRATLLHYNLRTGVFEPLTAGAKTARLCGIRPDSKKILFATDEVDYTQPEFMRCSLFVFDLETRECRPVFENEKYSVAVGGWSPDGRKIVLVSCADAFGRAGSTLPEGQTANSFDLQAYLYDFDTEKIEPITRDFAPSISSVLWAGDGNIYFTTVDRDLETVYRYEPGAKKFTRIRVPAEVVSAFGAQRDPEGFKPKAYAIGAGATAFPQTYEIDLKKNEARVAFSDGFSPEAEIAMPQVKTWTFEASDGTEIDGCFFLPPDFDASKKYPMIVYYYGGTTPTARRIGSHYPFPLYAAQGYVVYVVQPSGTIGYGQEFAARHLNAWGKRTADDIIEGVKKFCAEHPFVDAKKIGCIGASYGGFMTMYLQTRTDIFAAAVAHAGISDITSYWGEGMWGCAYNAIAAAGSFPWKNREIFVDQSPLFSADKVKTPILLCHGLSDTNVPVGESIQMFAALKILGKPVELLTFTGEDHGIANYARRKQWMKSHLAWFARWLKGEPDWWNTLYPDRNW